MSEAILSVRSLSIDLEGRGERRPIISNVSFDLLQGQVLGIIGESGSGKTVLSRAVVNWINPPLRVTGGEVMFKGHDLLTLPEREMQPIRGRSIGYVGANPGSALDPTLSIGTQIVEKLQQVVPGTSAADAKARVIDLLDAVRIPSARQRFDDFPFQFSGGMMQRVLIVDALVSRPAFLVADNITQPLDVTVSAQIIRIMKELQKDFDTAILFVSSSLGVVQDVADEVLVLESGKVIEHRKMQALIREPEAAYTRRLIAKVPRIWTAESVTPTIKTTADRDIVLSVRDISKSYAIKDRSALFQTKSVQAVRNVSFDVERGENFGIVGESGCGKSTLSRLLSRLEAPDAGEIMFKGKDIARLNSRDLLMLRKSFQLLLQDPYNAIPSHFPVGRTVCEPLRIHGGMTGAEVRERARAAIAEVGLPAGVFDNLPIGLSAGQRQRVNIARALVLEPELMILDETLSSLDQIEQGRLIDLFERLQAKHGMSYIYISHDLAMVRRVCTRVAVMYLGRVVELADNETLFFDSAHPYTRALLSAAPVIEAKRYDTGTYLLDGEPPDPIDIPPGCSFRTRCPFAFERCSVEDPALYSRDGRNFSACHLISDDSAVTNAALIRREITPRERVAQTVAG
ncbi:MAG: ABC transporter ATP-binding protein [Rhizobiaceae bacterium]|nr:ABC transporter ATP-binding protein [Rhizobiaceae bacterium]